MNKISFKNLVVVAAAAALMAVPTMSSAQRWPTGNQNQNQGRWNQNNQNNNRSLKQQVDRTERESNDFRQDFERQYRGRDRGRNYNRQNDFGFWGMDLKSDIQKMDEAFERLRGAVDKYDNRGYNNNNNNRNRGNNNGRYGSNFGNNSARREMETIMRYAREIDSELGRGFSNTRGNGRSLTSQWRSLHDDIMELGREFNVRTW